MSGYTEDELIEQPAIELFGELGYEVARCFNETFGRGGTLGRENRGEIDAAALDAHADRGTE
jgi:type I restriction enzyme R subunit